MSNVAAISARSAPARITSAPPRPPHKSCSASTTMDLPAPVSPVSTVSPGRNSSSIESMIAKSRICRWVSIVALSPRKIAATAAAPLELGAQEAVVVVVGGMQQRDALPRRLDLEHGIRRHVVDDDAIARHLPVALVTLDQPDFDDRARGHHHRPVG